MSSDRVASAAGDVVGTNGDSAWTAPVVMLLSVDR
jgi:hypothetical protein